MEKKERRKTAVFIVIIVLFTIAFYWFAPHRISRDARAVILVKTTVSYQLKDDQGDSAFISSPFTPEGIAKCSQTSSETEQTFYGSGYFVSNGGHLLTINPLQDEAKRLQHLSRADIQEILRKTTAAAKDLLLKNKDIAARLNRFQETHHVSDEGYNEVLESGYALLKKNKNIPRLLSALESLRRRSSTVKICLQTRYEITGGSLLNQNVLQSWSLNARRLTSLKEPFLLLQSSDKCLPQRATRLSIPLMASNFFLPRSSDHIIGYETFRPIANRALLPDAIKMSAPRFSTLSGSPVFNVFGQVIGGVGTNGDIDETKCRKVFFAEKSYFQWFVYNLRMKFFTLFHRQTHARLSKSLIKQPLNHNQWWSIYDNYQTIPFKGGVYSGQIVNGKPDGIGEFREKKGDLYQGFFRNGKKNGPGELIISDSARYTGIWENDLLKEGTRADTSGCLYRGGFDKDLKRSGEGSLEKDGAFYFNGQWKNDRREGFGIEIHAKRPLYAGIWKKDRYWGEEMCHNQQRIYGIDLSRYQHDIGKRTCRINWNLLRITDIGKKQRKIKGNVSYPISFIFFKATEGVSVKNRYYPQDLRAARKHGYKVGAYHFLSTTSPASAQAAWFLKNARLSKGDLPPVLDVEPSAKAIAALGGAKALYRHMLVWLAKVERAYRVRPILYISQMFVNKYMKDAPESLKKYPVWIARYGSYKPYVRLKYWQLTPFGRVRGIHSDVDINVYNGFQEQFNNETCIP